MKADFDLFSFQEDSKDMNVVRLGLGSNLQLVKIEKK